MVAKLDRLARNVAFTSALMETAVELSLACDNPHANRLTIHILAAVARRRGEANQRPHESRPDSGESPRNETGQHRPGHWEGREEGRLAGLKKARQSAAVAAREAAQEAYADLFPLVKELHTAGKTLQVIADLLNAQGHTTRRGKSWGPVQVLRVLKRSL